MSAPGKLIKVNDTHIHVYEIENHTEQGQGTIVFLAGSGTECPTYDFKPLWHLLVGKYHMAVVERPGYGWSGKTEYPRDIDTVLDETRTALRQAGIKPPYISAAHSLSGLEALYWAQKYPDEVSAIIGLDMAVPAVYESSMKIPKTMLALQVHLGHLLRKPVAKTMVKNHPATKSNLLDAKEQMGMRYVISKQLLSKNMMDEIDFVEANAQKVAAGNSPSVPVLCFLANDKNNLKRIPAWGSIHRDYFAANSRVRFVDLPCGHYVHREASEIIAKEMADFFSDDSPCTGEVM